jgi:hypothetical protein
MDVERCIALHNEILRYGWVGSGRSPESLESGCRTWFDTFGEEAEAIRSDLAPDLIRFLEHARFIRDPESKVNFFYWVQNLASPEYMLQMSDMFPYGSRNGKEWKQRYMVLYAMSNFTGHICGLV